MFGEIKNAQGERLDYTFHAGRSNSQSLVVLGHGVTGNKDRPFLVALAEGLAGAGISALRFSFSGNGASGGRFVDSTVTKEVEDLVAVLDALKGRTVGYAGHSMGGAVGVLRASRDTRIKLLISLAGMVHTKAFAQREFGTVKPGQGCMWDDASCPLSKAYMDDLTTLNTVVDRAPQIHVPWLLVHGTADDVIPIQDSRDIFARANEPKQFAEIEGSGHVFSGEFTSVMVEKVVAWSKTQFVQVNN
ncbi:MAG: alpha/beta fold hydrolase [Verrucomicrobia bacterium]|nr:alpha/beta fold hydrolase [Verrucomicrobiota bacterium]